jgi:hypothetical protein
MTTRLITQLFKHNQRRIESRYANIVNLDMPKLFIYMLIVIQFEGQ